MTEHFPDRRPGAGELARRLHAAAASTPVSPNAWDRIAARTVDAPHQHNLPFFVLAGAAAAVLAGAIAVVAITRSGGEAEVTTTDGPPTSNATIPTTPAPTPSTSSSPDTDATVAPTTTTLAPTTTMAAPASTGPAPTDPPVADPAVTTSPPTDPPLADPPETTTTTLPPRAAPAITMANESYTVEVIAQLDPGLSGYFRRTDDATSTTFTPGRPDDAYGSSYSVGWGDVAGARCVLSGSSGGSSSLPDEQPHIYTFGFVGDDAVSIEVVMSDGARLPATISGERFSGLRPWILERPAGMVTEVVATDAAGATWSATNLFGDYGQTGCR